MNPTIDPKRFNNEDSVAHRINLVSEAEQGPLRTALTYLYFDNGPINLPRERLLLAEAHLDEAERIIVRWLYTRTNGNLRKTYGANALRAARSQRYCCQDCGVADVRVLNLDHINGRSDPQTPFACLCANCHTIKSRDKDWTGK